MDIAALRTEYTLKSMDVSSMDNSPLKQFSIWLEEAITAKVNEPNAMNLSTTGEMHKPKSRIVLLKDIDNGFIFYTNYQSNKGKQLLEFPYAALTFFWPELQRQVRIEGKIEKVSPEISDSYFKTRPKSSQIGAWASPQSQEIPNREFIESKEAEMIEKFRHEPIVRPEHWGGYRLIPESVEFWQGRASRLHDRILYTNTRSGKWTKARLAP
ncbi:pyridoxamine 5'-phosphate oxidase [Echinicola marina]|uniref:pyridoxamine 5'-phosphate oxidase n=1 Tax=Echinicola marina TaxID=2859768 RepID=UPI001CF71B01|nr:pyridoxamine 5'-phosphate oxidase [Echinicola marina]UCS92658.1 pyridoxamine 5'-phosphate oxidase [Echinicola marina]